MIIVFDTLYGPKKIERYRGNDAEIIQFANRIANKILIYSLFQLHERYIQYKLIQK